jgi:hypothetical protein
VVAVVIVEELRRWRRGEGEVAVVCFLRLRHRLLPGVWSFPCSALLLLDAADLAESSPSSSFLGSSEIFWGREIVGIDEVRMEWNGMTKAAWIVDVFICRCCSTLTSLVCVA